MNAGWQRRLHLGARALGWVAGVVLIALAVLMALAQLLQPLVLLWQCRIPCLLRLHPLL